MWHINGKQTLLESNIELDGWLWKYCRYNLFFWYIAAEKSKNSTDLHALISHLVITWRHQAITWKLNQPDVRRHRISLSDNELNQLIFIFLYTQSVSNAPITVMAFLQHAEYDNSVSHVTDRWSWYHLPGNFQSVPRFVDVRECQLILVENSLSKMTVTFYPGEPLIYSAEIVGILFTLSNIAYLFSN